MADKTVMDMFADMAKQINLPKIDYEAFLDIHRKNIEAMQKSAAALSEGGRAVFAFLRRQSRIPRMSRNWSRGRAAKRPRSFLIGCARAFLKRGRPSNPKKPERLCCNAEELGRARGLQDEARDFVMIRLAVTSPKVRTGRR